MSDEGGKVTIGSNGALSPADMLNGFVGSHVIDACHEIGLLEVLSSGERLNPADLASRLRVARAPLDALVRAAQQLGYLSTDEGGRVTLTSVGQEMIEVRGYFTVSVRGFGDVFRNLASLTLGTKEFGREVNRDASHVAVGCAENANTFQIPILEQTLVDVPRAKVVDLGCGDASRLMALCHREGIVGVGVDIDPDVCALARERVRSEGLVHRISIIEADLVDVLRDPSSYPATADADLVTNFFLMHHLLESRVSGRGTLEMLSEAFPQAEHLLIADGFAIPQNEASLPIFSIGFELFHSMAGVEVGSREGFEAAIAAAGMTVRSRAQFGHPNEWIYLLSRPE